MHGMTTLDHLITLTVCCIPLASVGLLLGAAWLHSRGKLLKDERQESDD